MFIFILIFIVSLFLVLLLNIFSFLISESLGTSREELSTYECGFEHHEISRIPFSLRYFYLTLIFLLFDLEILLLIFLPSFEFTANFLTSVLLIFLFVLILFLGLIYEWLDGSLDWVI